ncbi:MAG TPA: OB-fold nucleic acid binding domain-containing protein [Candidatus Sulfotelmatobacter sp.]|nr:OB-fold nucleic acid binding domain-containing protein [Candidatus Sulfotelmatobacter sp.]
MMDNEIVQTILNKCPDLTENQILAMLQAEKNRTNGLIADKTLLRIIATNHGVELPKESTNDCKLLISYLIPSLNNVTIVGRIVAVYPAKAFEGVKPGKYASLIIADKDELLRVMLWNNKADLIESGIVKVGQVVRFMRGYTKADRNGKTELHIGEKSDVEVDPQDINKEDYPSIGHFVSPVKGIKESKQSIHLVGKVENISPLSTFTRQDNSVGKVLRFRIRDMTGDIEVVAWNEKAEKLEASLKNAAELILINARVKPASSNSFEVHVDEFTYVEVFDGLKQ